MKTFKKIVPLLITLALVACNEKVSSELENSASSSGGAAGGAGGAGGGGGGATEKYFRITNASDDDFNYKLHRTGFAYNQTANTYKSNRDPLGCKVSTLVDADYDPDTDPSEVSLNHTNYLSDVSKPNDQKLFDITCFLEVEELSMVFSGFSLKLEASPGLCDYVAYEPYGYYSSMPGASTSTVTRVDCGTTVTDGDGNMPASEPILAGRSCNTDLENGRTEVTALTGGPEEYCRYDYTASGGPNCDEGVITMNTYTIADPDTTDATNDFTVTRTATPPFRCGGRAANCVNGPIRLIGEAIRYTSYTQFTRTEGSGFENTYIYPAILGSEPTWYYANYRRNLANTQVDYEEDAALIFRDTDTATVPEIAAATFYALAFNPQSLGLDLHDRTFEPRLMENYARNRRWEGNLCNNANQANCNVTNADVVAYRAALNTNATPFAAEPMLSISPSHPINPFYTYTCMDLAKEPKARIRVVVREWDRIFTDPDQDDPDAHPFDYLSDLYLSEVIDGDPSDEPIQDNWTLDDLGDEFNDFQDWDDMIPMTRTPGAVTALTADYEPTVGWFGYFPNDLFDDE